MQSLARYRRQVLLLLIAAVLVLPVVTVFSAWIPGASDDVGAFSIVREMFATVLPGYIRTTVALGLMVAVGIYNVEPLEYLIRCQDSLTLTHVGIGLLKGTVYAMLVALAGCRQGLHAGRSAQAVGDATTAAVVQAIVWIVVAASIMTMTFQRLGW